MYLVTGASSGIGLATARAIASRGVKVIAVARDAGRLQLLKCQHPDSVQGVIADLSTLSGVDSVLEATAPLSTLSGIVHAAGSRVPLTSYQRLEFEHSDLQQHFAVHVEAPIALNNGLAHRLLGARVLFVDSYSADDPRVGWAAYSIVKAAARMAARAAAAELTDSTIIRVLPGGVRTPLVEDILLSQDHCPTVKTFRALNQAGGLVEPEAVGAFLCNLLIDATDTQLASREVWRFDNPDDRATLEAYSTD